MDWENIQTGFFDELSKIATIGLQGLSPETILEKGQPAPPMETPGLTKAQAILDRAQTVKTAARLRGSALGLPQYQSMGGAADGPAPAALDKAKRVGINAVGGMGIGKLVTEAGNHVHNLATRAPTPLKPSSKTSLIGLGIGGGLGIANYARNVHRERQFEKAKMGAFESPAEQLKANRQVGTIKNDIHAGPTIKAQIPLIGRKGVPGGIT